LIHQQRLIKSKAEVKLLKKACEIASETFTEVMNFTQPGRVESDLWAKMEFGCKLRGANYLAYPPVVAGGNRANTIHYIANTQVLKEGELVLMDAGCHYHGYCSDVTRTWPVSGTFDPYQRALYELLLKVQYSH
jgi:Xaa-Pro aminopeptidase